MSREFSFTDKHFNFIRTLVAEKTGIALSEAKRDMVYSRLTRRLRKLGIDGFDQYCDLLRQEDDEELIEFINAITTNLTSFFRENHHFDYLKNKILPSLFANNTQKRLRIWSAGCSTGEEPYSLAMVVNEVASRYRGWDIKILATDLDSNVVATAADGIYLQSRVNGVTKERLHKYFRRRGKGDAAELQISAELKRLITFKQLNLMHEWPMQGLFDIIFCRNVVIYFNKDTQRALFDRYADILADDGHLFVGHSETLFRVSERFSLLGGTIYKKKPAYTATADGAQSDVHDCTDGQETESAGNITRRA
jgi:chemotaxis protein methyltransferase CheR